MHDGSITHDKIKDRFTEQLCRKFKKAIATWKKVCFLPKRTKHNKCWSIVNCVSCPLYLASHTTTQRTMYALRQFLFFFFSPKNKRVFSTFLRYYWCCTNKNPCVLCNWCQRCSSTVTCSVSWVSIPFRLGYSSSFTRLCWFVTIMIVVLC